MIAAIYARKSPVAKEVADDAKSVTRQQDHAREFAARKGWAVDDAYVFVDDNISGAEFEARPGLQRLLAALKSKPPFEVLVMSEESRLGREQIETAYVLKRIVTAGVRVFTYLDEKEITLDTPTDRFMVQTIGFAATLERDRARQRVVDAMVDRARAGYACGPAPFGYSNVPCLDARGRRSYVEIHVNEPEAAVVRRIFSMSAFGVGYSRIAKVLNREGAPAPKPKRRRDALGEFKAMRPPGWTASTVKTILDRRRYLGEAVWNQTKKRDDWGQWDPGDRPEAEWIRSSTPAIITEAEWDAAHDRLTGVRKRLDAVGAVRGKQRDVDSKYLLSGFSRCGICGSSLGVLGGGAGRGRRPVYGCTWAHKTGRCSNSVRVEMTAVDAAVLNAIADEVLSEVVVKAVVDGVLKKLAPDTVSQDVGELRAALQGAEREVRNITRAIARGGELESLLDELRDCEKRRDELRTSLNRRERLQPPDRAALEMAVRRRVDDWRGLLTRRMTHGRQLLRELLRGPIRFDPQPDRSYRFSGEASFGSALTGEVFNGSGTGTGIRTPV